MGHFQPQPQTSQRHWLVLVHARTQQGAHERCSHLGGPFWLTLPLPPRLVGQELKTWLGLLAAAVSNARHDARAGSSRSCFHRRHRRVWLRVRLPTKSMRCLMVGGPVHSNPPQFPWARHPRTVLEVTKTLNPSGQKHIVEHRAPLLTSHMKKNTS